MNFHDTKARFSRRASDNTKHLSASQNEITRQSNGGKHLQNSSTNTYYIQNKKIFSTDPSSDAVRRSSEFCSARIEQQAGGPPFKNVWEPMKIRRAAIMNHYKGLSPFVLCVCMTVFSPLLLAVRLNWISRGSVQTLRSCLHFS